MEKIKVLYPKHFEVLFGAPARVQREVMKRINSGENKIRIDYLKTQFPSLVRKVNVKLRPPVADISSLKNLKKIVASSRKIYF